MDTNLTHSCIAFFALAGIADCFAAAEPRTVAVHDTSINPFIMPQGGKEIGDPFPSYWDGVWHIYTLSADLRQVYHLTSTDLVKWNGTKTRSFFGQGEQNPLRRARP